MSDWFGKFNGIQVIWILIVSDRAAIAGVSACDENACVGVTSLFRLIVS